MKISERKYYIYILFLVWPFGALLLSLRKFTKKNYRLVILLFSILFGYAVYLFGGDILRYESTFKEIAQYSWSDYWHFVTHLYSENKLFGYNQNIVNTQPDLFALTLQFLVSRITENPRWFWAVLNLIYTYFFLQFLTDVFKEIKWVGAIPQLIFFTFLVLIIPYYVGVTGVRFWTALFIFMTCVIKYVKYEEKKYLFYSIGTVLVHFSFFLPVALLFLYRFVPSNRYVILALMVISLGFFVGSTNSQVLEIIEANSGIFSDTPIEDRVESYTNEEMLAERSTRSQNLNWYVTLRSDSIFFFLIILFPLEAMGFFNWGKNRFAKKLFPMMLIFFCLTLFTFNLGSIGRFKNVFYLLCLTNYSVLYGLNPESRSLKLISYLLLPVLILYTLVTFRSLFYFIDPLLIVGNPVVIYLFRSDQSLSELIVGH